MMPGSVESFRISRMADGLTPDIRSEKVRFMQNTSF